MAFGVNPSVLGTGAGPTTGVIVGPQGLFPNGTAAAPSIAFANDTGTGYYLSSTGVIGISLSGVARGTFSKDTHYFYFAEAGTAAYIKFGVSGGSNPGAIGINAAGTNQSITLTPSGTGRIVCSTPLRTPSYTVATLPASPAAGDRAQVTDANATTFLSTVAAGGSNVVPVFYDGTNWKIG